MDRRSNASVDGTPSLPLAPPPTACTPSFATGDYPRPDHGSDPPLQLDSAVSSATAASSVPLSSPLNRDQHEQASVPAADLCGPAALNPSNQAVDKSLRPAAMANSSAVVENERLKRAFCLNSGSAAPAGCTDISLHSGSSTIVSGVGGAKSATAAVVASSAQRLPLSPSRPLNCSGNNGHNRPINDVLNAPTAGLPSAPSAVAASCASTAPSRAHGTFTAVLAPIELSRSWQKNTAQVASASQALVRLAPASAIVCQTVAVSSAGTPQAPGAIARPPMPSASVVGTLVRLPSPSLTVAVFNAAAATTAPRQTSSAPAVAVAAGPTARASAAAAHQEAARIAAANILKGVFEIGFAVTCLTHQAYRDALAGGTGRSANQLLDHQQLGRNDGSRNSGTSGSRLAVAEVTPASTTVDATADSVVDQRLRLVCAVDESSRCMQRSALEVLALVLPQRYVCGYYSRFDNTRCTFRTESQLVLERHRRTAHVDAGGRLACARCGFTVRTAGYFHQHCTASHGDEGVHEAPTKALCCPVCTYETAHPNRAQRHVERCVPAFDEAKNLRPTEEALFSTCATVRDCRPTVASVLAEAQIAAALSHSTATLCETTASASAVVHREAVVTSRPNVGISNSQRQPSIVVRPPGGGTSVSLSVTDGQQLLLQRRSLPGAAQMPRASAAARARSRLPGSVVVRGDNYMAVVAATAAVVPQQQPVVRLTTRPAVLPPPPGNSTAASATATAAAIAALQHRPAVTSQQSVGRLVVLGGQQVASTTGSQQQPAPNALQQRVLRPPQLFAPAVARSTYHQVVAVARLGELQSSWPVQLQHAPLRGAVVPTTQAQLHPRKPAVAVTEVMVAENAKRRGTVTFPAPPPLRPTGRHQLSPPSIVRPPALSSPTGRPSPLLSAVGRPPAAMLPTSRPTGVLPQKAAAVSSASRNLGRASAPQVHPAAADAKAKSGPSFSPNATISQRQLINCDICHNFLDKCDLPLHMARRHPDGLEHDVHIQCDQCSHRFAEVGPLVEHLLATHLRHDPAGPRPRQNSCFICLLPVNVETLLIHIAVNHSKVIFKMFNVRVCESPLCMRDRIVYSTEQQLSVHVLERHGMPTATLVPLVRAVNRMIRLAELDPRFWERCEQCNLTFRLRGEFLEHLQHDHLRYPCRLCSVGYLNAESLQWHMRRYHAIGAPPRQCTICRVPVASDRLIDHCMAAHPHITRAHVRLMRLPYRPPAAAELVVATVARASNEAPIETASMPSASHVVEALGSTRSDVVVEASEPAASGVVDAPKSTSDVIVEAFESVMSHIVETPKSATANVAVEVPASAIFDGADGAVALAIRDPAVEASASASDVTVEAPASVTSNVALKAVASPTPGLAVEAFEPATSDVAIEAPTLVASDAALVAAASATSGMVVEAAVSPTSDLAVEASTAATSDRVVEAPTFADLNVALEAATSATSVMAVQAAASPTSDLVVEASAAATSDMVVEAAVSPTSDLAVEASTAATSDMVVEAPTFAVLNVALESATSATSVVAVQAAASPTSDLVVEASASSTSVAAIEAPAFAISDAAALEASVAMETAASAMPDIADVPKAVMSDIVEGTKPAMLIEIAESPMRATLAVIDNDLQHTTREELDEDIEPPAKKMKV